MKLFIFGHPDTLNTVRRYILKNHSDIDFETSETEIAVPGKLEKQIQYAEANFDCVLFTGRTPYDILLSRRVPQKPWTYIKRQASQMLSVLLQASAVNHYDICSFSIDSTSLTTFEPHTLERIFHSISVTPSQQQITQINVDPTEADLVKTLVSAHERAYRDGKAAFCITSVSPVYEQLSAKEIPVFRIDFDENAIENAIVHLRMLHLQHSQNKIEVKMAMIEIYDQAEGSDNAYQQKSSLRSRLEVMEKILELSNSLNGALIEIGNNQFCLVFYEHGSHCDDADDFCSQYVPYLIKYAQQKEVKIHIGIGIHPSPRHCRQYALRALGQARSFKSSSAFLCDNCGQLCGPLHPASQSDQAASAVHYSEQMAWNISKKTGIPVSTIENLLNMKITHNGEFSSHDLALTLGISGRNANRLIVSLEEQHLVEISGKKMYSSGGRPLRIFRIII